MTRKAGRAAWPLLLAAGAAGLAGLAAWRWASGSGATAGALPDDLPRVPLAAGEGVTLRTVVQGPEDGPLVILLHGFPESATEWRALIPRLAAAGYRVLAPDQRGYGDSSKPQGAEQYVLDRLAEDVVALAEGQGRERFSVVGHDWGAALTWHLLSRYGDRLERAVAINAPHPAVMLRLLRDDAEQQKRSAYITLFRKRGWAEFVLSVGGYAALKKAFASAKRPYPPEAVETYRRQWSRPGALTGMLNWYRALDPKAVSDPGPGGITTPTLILWGDKDVALKRELADLCAELCTDVRVRRFPDASHWLPNDEPDGVAAEVLAFLGDGRTSG